MIWFSACFALMSNTVQLSYNPKACHIQDGKVLKNTGRESTAVV
jgi:hypothetical protein